jgi:hypothetical protein
MIKHAHSPSEGSMNNTLNISKPNQKPKLSVTHISPGPSNIHSGNICAYLTRANSGYRDIRSATTHIILSEATWLQLTHRASAIRKGSTNIARRGPAIPDQLIPGAASRSCQPYESALGRVEAPTHQLPLTQVPRL